MQGFLYFLPFSWISWIFVDFYALPNGWKRKCWNKLMADLKCGIFLFMNQSLNTCPLGSLTFIQANAQKFRLICISIFCSSPANRSILHNHINRHIFSWVDKSFKSQPSERGQTPTELSLLEPNYISPAH